MKDQRDPGSIDLFSSTRRKPGPKPSGNAKSAAERMREYRARTVPVRRGVLEAAVAGAGQVDAVAFQVDGMDQLAADNAALRERLQDLLDAVLPVVLLEPDAAFEGMGSRAYSLRMLRDLLDL